MSIATNVWFYRNSSSSSRSQICGIKNRYVTYICLICGYREKRLIEYNNVVIYDVLNII
jgi:hypothetical protein